ncbi:lipopolysaccharide biosynthesis protein [Candidatus Vondammii sp. HM_W22]|uniref:lipopolysaccharide biosynthesis protein n=1 Tax=Candidatus Vondammii sp. HM_W22 TaxID=2687299 RepID=UPI001F13B007|nr:oligosaccharide flippase family protein [Candidatus Vondammii sp. HM_W22]
MTKNRNNVIANYIGAGWSAALSFVTIPLLLSMLGAEYYGLISLFLALKAIATVFDFGLAVATNREVVFRLEKKSSSVDTLITTVVTLYWVIGIVISFVVWLLLQIFLIDWVSAKELTSDQLAMTSLLFTLSLSISWPVALYQNILRSIDEYVTYNIALAVSATFRNPGALLVLWIFSPTIEVFMYWYLMASVLEILMYWGLVRRKLSLVLDYSRGRFDCNSLSGMKRFALGTGFSSIVATIIYQVDKMLIFKLLSLELLGYYSAILALVGAFGKLTAPIATAAFPKLTSTYGSGDMDSVADMYLRYAHMITNVLVPMVVGFIAFAPQILELWCTSCTISNDLYYVFVFLSIAYMFYSLADMPVISQMVFKNINILIISRVVALVLLVPLLSFLIVDYGLEGAAVGVLACSVFLYIILAISTSKIIFPQYRVNEPVMLVKPLLISISIFYSLQHIYLVWSKDSLTWISLAVVGAITSYLIIFRSYFVRAKKRDT